MKKKLLYLYRWDLLFLKIQKKIRAYKKCKSDVSYWQIIKDKHKGKAGFVIGNGPSLKMEDLSKIHNHGYISIASNKISLAFKETLWRPNYYTIADPLVWSKISKNIDVDIEIVHVPSHFEGKDCNVKVKCWKPLYNNFRKELSNISDNLSVGAFGGFTVTYENIQIALHLGLNPIYIIGCDHYYPGDKGISTGELVEDSGIQNHFIKEYKSPGEKTISAPIKKMTQAYEIARLYSDKYDVKIFNATRGGHLEAFKRIDLDSVLK